MTNHTFGCLCDRCGHPFTAHHLTPHCLRCAIAFDTSQTANQWARPTTPAELVTARNKARNHT